MKLCIPLSLIASIFFMCANPASFKTSQVNVTITELMYNTGEDSLEFIELKNSTSGQINLKGVFFSEGIDFSFNSDFKLNIEQYCILTNNEELFRKKYPGIPVGGVFSGRLSDNGEKVTLCDSISDKLTSIEYNDKGFWPSAADGLGFSIVPVDEDDPGDQNDASDWRASSVIHGSPGQKDPDCKKYAVLVNELVTSTLADSLDMIELFNEDSTESVDISGWYLTDDRHDPLKYIIPDGTTIKSRGYKTFKGSSFKNKIAVSIAGGQIYLFSATKDGSLTGYSHGIEFETSDPGTVFGLTKNSDGHYFCTTLANATKGAVNAAPLSGNVVISEIMYHPQDNDPEFLEIVNRTEDTIRLFTPENPSNTWKISGISFVFPTGIILGGSERILLIDSTISIDQFRENYSIDTAVKILTYSGKLSNSGETIAIQKVGAEYVAEDGSITIPYQDIDIVSYKDGDPWPEKADGDGFSLVRKDLAAWGCEPSNWDISDTTGGTPGK